MRTGHARPRPGTRQRAGLLSSVTDWLGHTTTFGYDGNSNLTSISYPNGVSQVSAYDSANQVTSVTDSTSAVTLAKFTCTHNGDGLITSAGATGLPASGELLVAFISASGPSAASQTITAVTGAGLTWKRAGRSDKQPGIAEIWEAYACGVACRGGEHLRVSGCNCFPKPQVWRICFWF